MLQKDYTFDELVTLANDGNIFAMDTLAHYLLDHGNIADGINWLKKASENGCVHAAVYLAVCYLKGRFVDYDYTQGIKLLTKWAEAGYTDIQFRLAREYYYGEYIPKDYNKAVFWLTKSIQQVKDSNLTTDFFSFPGRPEFLLGKCYEYGRGMEKNISEAIRWYTIAESKGDLNASDQIRNLNNINSKTK